MNRFLYHTVCYVSPGTEAWQNFCRTSLKSPSKVVLTKHRYQVDGRHRHDTIIVLAQDWHKTDITAEDVERWAVYYTVLFEKDLKPLQVQMVAGRPMIPASIMKPEPLHKGATGAVEAKKK